MNSYNYSYWLDFAIDDGVYTDEPLTPDEEEAKWAGWNEDCFEQCEKEDKKIQRLNKARLAAAKEYLATLKAQARRK